MNDVRTYRAATMQEALDLVRNELGSEAVILNTRQVSKRRLLPWAKREQHVEITAGLNINIRSRQPAGKPAARTNGAAKNRARPKASAPAAQPQKPQPPSTPPSTNPRVYNADVTFERTTTDDQIAGAQASLRTAAPRPATTPHTPPPIPAEFGDKLDSIQRMLQELGRGKTPGQACEVPGELFQLFTNLIDAEVEDEVARELMARLKQTATPAQLQNTEAALSLLTAMVEKEIACCGPIVPNTGKRKVIALVGSTGVGKTTTIAKLAANFRLRDGVKMGLVTVDTYRIAAVEQLRTYAEIIDLPMKVVTSPPEMRRALEELVGLDLVLIDTAGRSPRDELQIQELKSLLSEAACDEVHLVMNLTASLRTLEATARKFAAAGTTSLIVTKLDEAAGMGSLLSLARNVGLPFSYLTTGQDVPDDIEPANPTRIARLILGREKLGD